ncbi:MAG: NPCBM/NEW2 domain-containing protein [Planctomycetaceae bacterium]
MELVDGTSVQGEVVSLTEEALTIATGEGERAIRREDVLSLDLTAATPRDADSEWVLFANGDRAPLAPVELVDDQLVCRGSVAERTTWRIPVEQVTALIRQPLPAMADSPLLAELAFRVFRDDTVILQDGTRLTGAVESIGPEALRVESAVGSVAVEARRVAAVAMNSSLVQRPTAPDALTLAMLRNGAWLALEEATVSGGEIAGRTSFDAEYRAALSEVSRVVCFGHRVRDLTLYEPMQVSIVPFVSRRAELRTNRNVRGGWLKLKGREFARGFGMTSGMSASFALAAEDRQFRATVGLDDCVGAAGSVVFAVDVDGRRVFTSPVMTGRDAAMELGPLDVSGGRRLTLSVEFAEQGNVQDVADWCEPVILR